MKQELRDQYIKLLQERRLIEHQWEEGPAKKVKQINDQIALVQQEMAKASDLTLPERIALLFESAFTLHHSSFVKGKKLKADSYKIGIDEALEKSCLFMGVDPKLARLFSLAAQWENDIDDWADDVLTNSTWEQRYPEEAKRMKKLYGKKEKVKK